MELNYTKKAFKYSIINLLLFLIITFLLINFVAFDYDTIAFVISCIIFITGILSIIGSFKSVKSFSEKNSLKKIFAIIINFTLTLLFIIVIIQNFNSLIEYFTNQT